jgi:hypothetical protein
MKTRALGIMGVAGLLVVMMSVTAFAVPLLINFQGELTDDTGAPLDGSYQMDFYIYNQATGGTALWNETQTVAVSDGIYNVKLGAVAALSSTVFEGDSLYLEVIVESETLSPRQQITSVAYAMKAKMAEGVAAGGITSSMLASGAVTSSAIQDGATMTEILDDDGPGSQLNCDYIDGLDASAFASAAHDHDSRYYTKSQVDTIVSGLESRIATLETLLANVSRVGNDLTFSGMNVKIVDGSGSTYGTVNGRGNLIVGYNELRGGGYDNRTGSHNIVVGSYNNYSSYGGLIAGETNTISGPYSSVSGGIYNIASGEYASVSGGHTNTASGDESSVSGGLQNEASGAHASVSGGRYNDAIGGNTSVSGGVANTASGSGASVSGGYYNTASGDLSFVGGGGYTGGASDGNKAFGHYSAVLGGRSNIAGDPALTDHTIGQSSSVSGGQSNTASGLSSSVSGGASNTASGNYGSVSGGQLNTASGNSASVSGGQLNTASSTYDNVGGGYYNTASGGFASVSGGSGNTASGIYSSVSGGNLRSVSGIHDWRAGTYFSDN